MTTGTDSKPLTEYAASTVRCILDRLHTDRERYSVANRIVEVRSCDLEIAEATRALAIINRRATEAEDQRVGRLEDVVRRLHETSERSKDDGLRIVRQEVFEELFVLAKQPRDEHWDRLVTIADEAFGLGPVEPLDATLTRIERGIHEQHRRSENELSDLRQRLAAATAAGELVTAERDALRAQREADLREAVLYGCRFVADHITVDDGRGGPIINTPSLEDCEDLAAGYARSKAGG